jgi:hypothetical protein|tara:strand:+ start:166 stop:750 length:585 start_codon:yes stop_codon:yes gene_type:complete
MLSNFLVTQSGGTDTVTTTMILDGTIANADVASDAAIDVSKINLGNTVEMETSSGDQIFEMDNNASNSANFQIQNGAGNARVDFVTNASDGGNPSGLVDTTITMKAQKIGLLQTNPAYTLDVTGTGNLTSDLTVGGSLTLAEKAAAESDSAGYGQLWVKSDTPNTLYFTDDAGTDTQLGAGASAGFAVAMAIAL